MNKSLRIAGLDVPGPDHSLYAQLFTDRYCADLAEAAYRQGVRDAVAAQPGRRNRDRENALLRGQEDTP